MIEIKNEDHLQQETNTGITLVDVYAPWCGPCKMIAPALEELEQEMEGVKFVKVNADEVKEVAYKLGVMSIPTLVVLKDGVEVGKKVGFVPKEAIQEFIKGSMGDSEVSV